MKMLSAKSRCRLVLRIVVVGTLGVGSVLACDCIAPPVREEARIKAAVFTGKVSERIELPQMDDGRRRYEVHFSVAKQWKGSLPSEVVIYDAEPRGDCQGFGFEGGKEYVVFVRSRVVTKDVKQRIEGRDITFHDLWNDVLPVGKKIFIGEICTHTADISQASRTIRLLGEARRSQ
jgi:hypothetical protein